MRKLFCISFLLFLMSCHLQEEADVYPEDHPSNLSLQPGNQLPPVSLQSLQNSSSINTVPNQPIQVSGPLEVLPVIVSTPAVSSKPKVNGNKKGGCILPLKMTENNTSCSFPITLDIIFESISSISTTTITFQNTTDYVNLLIPENHQVRIDVSNMKCNGSFTLCKQPGNPWNFIPGFWGLCYEDFIIHNAIYTLTFPRHWPKNPNPVGFIYTTYLCDDYCSETLDYTLTKIDGQDATNSAFIQISLLPEDGQKFGSNNFFMVRESASVQNVAPVNTGTVILEPLLGGYEYTIEVKDRTDEPNPNHADLEFTVNPGADFAYYDNDFAPPVVTENFLIHNKTPDCDAVHTDCDNVNASLTEKHCGLGGLYQLDANISLPFSKIDWSATGNISIVAPTTTNPRNYATINTTVPATFPISLKIYLDNGCVVTKTIDVEFENSFDGCD